MNKDLWVIFDGYNHTVFNTYDEKYANFDMMADDEYNKAKCKIVKNPTTNDGEVINKINGINDLEYLQNGNVKKVVRPYKYKNPYRSGNKHIPSI